MHGYVNRHYFHTITKKVKTLLKKIIVPSNQQHKGTVSRDGNSTFCVCADGFQGLSKAFHCPIKLLVFFASLKLFANFENAY